MSNHNVIMGAFRTFEHARDAVIQLERAGVRPEHISWIGPEEAREHLARIDKNTKAPEGAAIGGATGIALGAIAAGLTAVAAVVIPGVGLLAAGPLTAALAGAGAGGAAGGALGGLIGLGIPEHEAKFHMSIVKEGGYIVAVSSDDHDEQKRAGEVLHRLGAKTEEVKGVVGRV
jgi:hypothetical protein